MPTIIVGVEDSPRSEDALAFARPLATAAGADVLLACALPEGADAVLARMAARLDGVDPACVRTVAVPRMAPPRALHELAETRGADLIVVGSTHDRRFGRATPGHTAQRLLHGAPCAVAVPTQGYRTQRDRPLRRIGVGFDDTPESAAALDAATAIAAALGAELRVIAVPEPGEPERELAAASAHLDLLVTGSRGYGPARAVLLGDVTSRLVREAACPLMVVPRGTDAPLGALFAAVTAPAR